MNAELRTDDELQDLVGQRVESIDWQHKADSSYVVIRLESGTIYADTPSFYLDDPNAD